MNDRYFITNDDGSVFLSEDGKKIFIEAFNNKLNSKITVDKKPMKYYRLLENEIRKYLKHIQDGVKYKPYKYY